MTCDDHDYYLLWTNPLYYLNYRVSLGWFYLLDIHYDWFLISPLCRVAETPDCGMLVNYLLYKPFMWCRSDARLRHARYLLSFRGVASYTRLVHFITTLLLHIHVAYK